MKAIVNVGLKQGVLDDQGKATHHALDTLGFKEIVKNVRQHVQDKPNAGNIEGTAPRCV